MLAAMRLGWWFFVLVVAVGCDSLSEFDTGDDEIYAGSIAGVNDPTNCPDGIDCSFIRRGFPYGTALDLQFDPFGVYDRPGTISTRGENCIPTFDNTPLLPIPPLQHDQLGLYDFPGGGRLRSFMFVARPETGPLAGRDAMVFLSLIRGGSIEVRVVAGPGLEICDPSDCATLDAGGCDFFGFFPLVREPL